ncbi:amidohydrolase family protein [Polyangium aurulentum]|uniref:amidohydrolase family protein n=1 Tax=Polyangium aurulentum TaxID=2567896 RepID=UPI0010AEE781|nr:amidohydrolase family protein [Polyangium aurulentum]UQA62051.1 amidohydrolase family protein [Polyangium aurulentum]
MSRSKWTGFFLAGFFAAGLFGTGAAAQPRPQPAQPAQPAAVKPIAVVGAKLHTGTGEVIEDGTIVIENGLIARVGKGVAVPAGAEKIDVKGAEVTPGLVDSLTAVGLVEVGLEPATHDDDQGGKDPIRAAFRAADGYNPASSVIGITRAEGVTSVGVIPTGGLISGQSAWADLAGAAAPDALAQSPLAMHVHLGALNDDRGGPASALLRLREVLDDARTFQKNRAAWERNQSRPFSASRLDLEALAGTLGGKVPVVFHVDRAADILSTLAVAKEMGLRPVIAGGAEAWKVAARLSAEKVPVMVNPIEPGPKSFDELGSRADNAALLHAAGVPVVITTGDTHNARKLRQLAGNAVRAGLPHEAAITAITRAPAEALGMGARYGTLAPGKVANLVVWSGDPLEISTRAVAVVIRGKRVELSNRQTALLARYRKLR